MGGGRRDDGHRGGAPRLGLLLAMIVGFVAAGVPLVAFGWHNLNYVLAGHLEPSRLVVVVTAAAGLGGLLYALSRAVNRLTGSRET